jgi:hypothetical protein
MFYSFPSLPQQSDRHDLSTHQDDIYVTKIRGNKLCHNIDHATNINKVFCQRGSESFYILYMYCRQSFKVHTAGDC